MRSMPSRLAKLGTTLAAVASLLAVPAAAGAATAFPGNGWANPTPPASFEDWHFGSCDGHYLSGKAHLGTDSQGTRAGQGVVAIGPGKVVKVVASNWGPGGAVGIEHGAGDGSRFLVVYGHINVGVGVGNSVSAGQSIGTLYNQESNSHLHLGLPARARGVGGVDNSVGQLELQQWKCSDPRLRESAAVVGWTSTRLFVAPVATTTSGR